jgi:hypothetical protein
MNEMKIPDELDWENYWDDLDAKYAYKNFFGKSNEEMQSYFEGHVMNFSVLCEIEWVNNIGLVDFSVRPELVEG